jgi:hypothetical protein
LINQFQYRLVVGNFLYLVSVVLAFFVVLFAPVVAILADSTVSLAERETAAYQMLALHERVWFAIPALVALCILHSIVVSHRIAGPLYRFKQTLARLAGGEVPDSVSIRRHDYLRQEAEIMHEMVHSLRQRVTAIHLGYGRAGATLPRLIDAIGRGDRDEAAVLAGKLGTQMDRLGQSIRSLRTHAEDRPVETPARTAPDTVAAS